MNHIQFHTGKFVILFLAAHIFPVSLFCQTINDKEVEDKIWGFNKIVPAEKVAEVPGFIRPIFWRCNIKNLVCVIPLVDIEFLAMQDYTVDGMATVLELTVGMRSKAFIRFYHAENFPGNADADNSTTQIASEKIASVYADIPVVPKAPGLGEKRVTKNYPVTTHSQMIEYRVKEKKQIYEIQETLETALVFYKAFPFIEEQRANTIIGMKMDDGCKADLVAGDGTLKPILEKLQSIIRELNSDTLKKEQK